MTTYNVEIPENNSGIAYCCIYNKDNSMLVSTIQEVEMLFPLKLKKLEAFPSKKIQDCSLVEEWRSKFGHPSGERYYLLFQATYSVPKCDRTLLQELHCILAA